MDELKINIVNRIKQKSLVYQKDTLNDRKHELYLKNKFIAIKKCEFYLEKKSTTNQRNHELYLVKRSIF